MKISDIVSNSTTANMAIRSSQFSPGFIFKSSDFK